MSLDKSQYVSISKTSTTTVLLPAKNLRLYCTPVILLIDVRYIYIIYRKPFTILIKICLGTLIYQNEKWHPQPYYRM